MQDLEPAVVAELADVFSRLARGHDVLPFLSEMHAAAAMGFRALPDDMLVLIVGSDDYLPIVAGAPPTWLSISGPEGHAEIIVYRALSDEQFYVAAPPKSAGQTSSHTPASSK